MRPSAEQVAARLAQLRELFTFEQVVALRLAELHELCELTRYLQAGTPAPFRQAGTAPAFPATPAAPSTPATPHHTPASTPPRRLDDDILRGETQIERPLFDPYFKQIFDQFVALKKSCNEPTGGLSYEKFAEKLVRNRDDLIAKTRCKEVRFTVYVKDGKAALQATPVKGE